MLGAVAALAQGEGRVLLPPRVVTPGVLKSLLTPIPAGLAMATAAQRRGAISRALADLGPTVRERVSARLGDRAGDRLGVARLVDASLDRLASLECCFGSLAARLPNSTPEEVRARIEALGEVEARAAELLGDAGLADARVARRSGVACAAPKGAGEIVLVGVAELDAELRAMLGNAPAPITACVLGPPERAADFDELGCVRPEAWQDRPIDLSRAVVRFVDTQAELCDATLGALGGLPRGTRIGEVVICAPDAGVADRLARRGGAWGARLRPGSGLAVSRLAPGRLLSAVRRFGVEGTFEAWGALLRHADMEAALMRVLGHPRGLCEHWLEALDSYALEHLPRRVEEAWRDGWARDVLAPVLEATANLLGPTMPGGTGRLGVRAWSVALGDLLGRIYAGAPDLPHGTRGALEQLARALDTLADVPGAVSEALDAGEAIGLLLDEAREQDVPREEDEAAVDVLGWLELTLDASRHVVVAGLSEGTVPARRGLDPLLPAGLLRGLGGGDGGAARDAYLLSLLAHSREGLTIVVSRRDAEGEPLAPSRLMLRCEDAELVERVRAWCPSGDEAVPGVPRPEPARAYGPGFARMPLDASREGIPTHWAVTSFRDYLASPYLFYAKSVLRLREVEAAGIELTPRDFGGVVHGVLREFARSAQAASTDEARIMSALSALLDERMRALAGDDPATAVAVQAEQARRRLEAYARWQAQRTREGWRVLHAEWSPGEDGVALAWERGEVRLVGRIDRIDAHAERGVALIDFKTADAAVLPEQAHRSRGRWKDLQLPLYRHLAAGPIGEHASRSGVELAYLCLGADGEPRYAPAEWDEAELARADEAAREVVRLVHERVFALEGEHPPTEGTMGALVGLSFLGAAAEDEEDGA